MSGLLTVASAVALTAGLACAAAPAPLATGVHRGPALPLGEGTAQAWVSVDRDGKPEALGVSLSAAAVASLDGADAAHLTLPFPAEAAGTGFNHVLLNWNPQGHPPAEVWGTPHVDVHFYTITAGARAEMSPDRPDFAERAGRHPELPFVPAGYFRETDVIPGMGAHWADEATPELRGEAFTHTLLYGSWDGVVRFIEPMVDKSVLDGRASMSAPVKQPAAVAAPGLYPTRYRIDFDPAAGKHRVVLEGLVPRR